MNTMRTLSVTVALALSTWVSAQAQEFRIGFISTDRIFREANTAKAAQT
jgi:outer membrane protein